MKKHFCLAGLLTLALIPIIVLADIDDEEELVSAFGDEEMISLATGRSQPISKAPAVATVITAEEIKEMGARDLDEVLETVPGLHVSASSVRFSPIYSIRGIYTDKNPQVLMLMNGVPITQVYFGDRGARSTLPVASIERVEVVRGPGSAIYGADAFAGVINVITKNASDINGAEGGVRYGSFDSGDAWALYGGNFGDLDVAVTVEYQITDGDDDRVIDSDTQSIFDSALGTNASLTPGEANTGIKRWDIHLDLSYKDWQLRAWNWRQNNVEMGPGLAQALDPTSDASIDNYLVDLSYDKQEFVRDWDFTGRFSYMGVRADSKQRLFPPNSVLPVGSDGNLDGANPSGLVLFSDGMRGNPGRKEDHFRFDVFSFFTGLEDHRLRFATGMHYVTLDPKEKKNFGPGVLDGTTLLPPPNINVVDGTLSDVTDTPYVYINSNDRTNLYASIQNEWSIAPDWNLTAGLRYDHYSDFGYTINPRIALVWETRHDLTTKLLYGRAFRAPSFAELFTINNPVTLGNPDLDPETINTIELAFDYRPSFDLRTGLNMFAYKVDDLIRFVPDASGTTSTAQNVGNQEGLGLELEMEWQVTPIYSLAGNYAFQYTEDLDTNSNAGNAPQHQIYLNSKWRFMPNWLWSTQFLWVGTRDRVDGDPRSDIDDYTMVNLSLRRENIIGGLGAALLVKNLFDKDASEPSPTDPTAPQGALVPGDFPLVGRYIGGELRYIF